MVVRVTEGNMSRLVVSQFHCSFASHPSTQCTGNEGKEKAVAISKCPAQCTTVLFIRKQQLDFEMWQPQVFQGLPRAFRTDEAGTLNAHCKGPIEKKNTKTETKPKQTTNKLTNKTKKNLFWTECCLTLTAVSLQMLESLDITLAASCNFLIFFPYILYLIKIK